MDFTIYNKVKFDKMINNYLKLYYRINEGETIVTTKQDIQRFLWQACDTFRGKIDSSRYKDYILSMLFVKYLSDVYKENLEKYRERYKGSANMEEWVKRSMSRETFYLDENSNFDYLYRKRNDNEIGQIINVALNSIEDKNSSKLKDVFRAIDFNSTVDFGDIKQKNAILRNLLEDFNNLNLRPSELEDNDIIGDAYEYMIANFASDAGKKGGEFYTPSNVSKLIAKLVEPGENDRIYDPTCGSGGLLLKVLKEVDKNKVAIYGQEQNSQTWALCKMNMFLHNVDDAQIYVGDTLSEPKTIENDDLMKFQVVVANPPFSLDKWDSGFISSTSGENGGKREKMKPELDNYGRFDWGVPPASKGDYAFVLHMIKCLDDNNGRMGVVLPHGVLFRGASEGKIRKEIIESNILDAVISLPANLFFGTVISACILVIKKNRSDKGVLFIDASGYENFEKGKNQNMLRDSDIEKILDVYRRKKVIDKYSYYATIDEIRGNDYNLNIPRYVNTFKEEEFIDIEEIKKNIEFIRNELKDLEDEMKKHMEELGI